MERVCGRSGDTTADEVLEQVVRGDAQLFDAEGSVIVTQLRREATGLVCLIWLAAGELEPLLRRHADIIAWAREQGCTKIRIVGRRGWLKVLHGYRETATVMEQELK